MAAPVRQYFDFLTGPGRWSPIAASAILGHSEQESGFNPRAVNADEGAEGMMQWRLDRREAMRRHVANSSLPLALAQLDFLSKEADQHKGLRERMNNAKTTDEAVQIFGKEYVRPKVIEPIRFSNAKNIYAGLADPNYSGAKGMTAERASATDAAPKRLRVSDVLAPEAAPKAAPEPKRLRVSDVLPDGPVPQENLPPPVPGQDYATGGTMEGGEGAMPPAQANVAGPRALADATRGATALPGMDQFRALGGAAGEWIGNRVTGKRPEASFSDFYGENLARERAESERAASEPGIGGVDLPLLGRVNANPYLAGSVLGGAALGRYFPTFGLERTRMPFAGALAGGLQGAEMAAMQLVAGSAGNVLSGRDWSEIHPSDAAAAIGNVAGGTLGGAVGDLAKLGVNAATRRAMTTPEMRSSEGQRAARQITDKLQDVARGVEPGGANAYAGRLAGEFDAGQARPLEMLADQEGLGGLVRGNAIANRGAPAQTVAYDRLARRQAELAGKPGTLLQSVYDGDFPDALATLKADNDQAARYLYEQAGLPRVDLNDLPAARATMEQAPSVPRTPEFNELVREPQFQRMVRQVRRDPLFRGLPDDSMAVLDQVYKLFNAGVDPRTGQASRAYAQTGRTLKSMVAKAISADVDFQPGQAYAQAVGKFAEGKSIEEAALLGQKIGSWGAEDIAAVRAMTDAERKALQMGAVSRLRTDLEGKGARGVQAALSKGKLRANLEAALGRKEATAFLDEVKALRPQMRTGDLPANSQTAEKAADALGAAPHTLPITKAGALNRVLQYTLNRLTPEPTMRPMPFTYQDIANDLLTRTDPAGNAAVLRDLMRWSRGNDQASALRRLLAGAGAQTTGAQAR